MERPRNGASVCCLGKKGWAVGAPWSRQGAGGDPQDTGLWRWGEGRPGQGVVRVSTARGSEVTSSG